jgi:tetratricopeptide (TPR) repeat protein/5-methylcytosine-specific restriction endonuclease McrA
MSQDTILEPLEAALFLGITPELLFSYTRNAPKSLDPGRKLNTIDREGRTGFRQAALEEFEAFLRAPWAKPDDRRPRIPDYVETYLKVECGGQCARCGAGFPLENAHIVDYAISLSHHHHNLIRLCSGCHDSFDKQILSRDELVILKNRLISKVKTRIEQRLTYRIPHARTIPVPIRNFVGREDEIADLGQALLTDRLIAIQGAGGCGKTELLVQTLARHVDQREIIWIEVDSAFAARAVEMSLRAALSSTATGGEHGLAAQLDHFGGYIVLDGVERAETGADRTFEDTIFDLIAATAKVRFVLTSQVAFSDIDIDYQLLVRPLGSEASQSILTANWSSSYAGETAALSDIERFAEGHPLTLRILNALLRHFEKASIVANRIAKFGAPAVSHPLRKKPHNETSLDKCLSTAFELLDEEAKRLMYIASYLPAGFIEKLVASEEFAITDPESAMATARRWNLLDVVWRTGDVRRLRALSPIRAFFRHRYAAEAPQLTRQLTFELVQLLAAHAMFMDHTYFSGGDSALGVKRFDAELPNIFEAFETARRSLTTEPRYLEWLPRISGSLQRYFFVSGSSQQSAHIVDVGLHAALQDGNHNKACTLAMHLLINGQRLDDPDLSNRAIATLRKIAANTYEPEVLAQRAIAESMLALEDGRLEQARQWAQTAASDLRASIAAASHGDEKHLLHLLSMALTSLGRADEEARRFAPALLAFEESLKMMVEDDDLLNRGAVHHQIANCQASLQRYPEAISHYLQAATLFNDGKISEHIGNSLSELGHLLVEHDDGPEIVGPAITNDVLQFGAEDVLSSMKWACQHRPAMNNLRTLTAVRRLIGFCMLLSLIRQEDALEEICELVQSQLVKPLSEKLNSDAKRGLTTPQDVTTFVMVLDFSIVVAGNLTAMSLSNDSTLSIEHVFFVAQYCHMVELGTFKRYSMFDWFAAYLRLRHNFLLLTGGALREAYLMSDGDESNFKLSGYDSLLST